MRPRKKRTPPTRTSTEPPGSLVTVDERVRYIESLMAAGKWLRSRDMQAELSAAWLIDRAQVRQYASEAHRRLALDPDERLQLRQQIARRMLKIHRMALRTTNDVTGLPDFRSATEALDKFALYSGIRVDDEVQQDPAKPVIHVKLLPPKGGS